MYVYVFISTKWTCIVNRHTVYYANKLLFLTRLSRIWFFFNHIQYIAMCWPRRHFLTCPCRSLGETPVFCVFSLVSLKTDWTQIWTAQRSTPAAAWRTTSVNNTKKTFSNLLTQHVNVRIMSNTLWQKTLTSWLVGTFWSEWRDSISPSTIAPSKHSSKLLNPFTWRGYCPNCSILETIFPVHNDTAVSNGSDKHRTIRTNIIPVPSRSLSATNVP